MVLYNEEKKYIEALRTKIQSGEDISRSQMEELLSKFEEMMEMSSVSIKMIDRLMLNYDKLKRQNSQVAAPSKNQ